MHALATGASPENPESWETWLDGIHAAARTRTSLVAPPVPDESWRYTRQKAFQTEPTNPGPAPRIQSSARGWEAVGARGTPQLGSLSEAYAKNPGLLTGWFGRMARPEARLLTALNAQAFVDGVFLFIPEGARLKNPIEIILGRGTAPEPAFPRVLILLGAGSSCEVIERQDWKGIPEDTGKASSQPPRVVNSVTEIHLAHHAQLTHYVEPLGDPGVRPVSFTAVSLEEGSTYRSFQFDGVGPLLRHEIEIRLEGIQAEAQVESLSLLGPREHRDREAQVIHATPKTRSEQRARSVVGAHATAIYGGRVHIQPRAAGSSALQDNHHLLLDPSACAMSRPELEIGTDEVRCTHGSKSGTLDRDALFYLKTRGIDPDEGRRLLIQGFTGAFLALIPSALIQSRWQERIATFLARTGAA